MTIHFLAHLLALTALGPDVTVKDARELGAALDRAAPGDRVTVAPGTYDAIAARGAHGTADAPIVITAADPSAPPVLRGGLHLSNVAHLSVSHLILERTPSNGLNIDDGGTRDAPSHHIEVSDLVVRDCGGAGNDDGIKLSGVDDVTIARCTIERWGRRGSAIDMVGCHRVVIVDCVIRDSASAPAASGVQCKGGSSDIVVRTARFEDAGQRAINAGGSTGAAFFRPVDATYEAKNVIVEGCVFVGSQAPIACVGVDGVTIRFNTIVRPSKWTLRILQETTTPGFVTCRNGSFTDNLVVYDGNEVREIVNVGPATAPETFTFARNFWFRSDAPARSIPTLPTAEADARGGVDPLLAEDARSVEDRSEAAASGAHAFVAGAR
jgi:hypothetical protein